MVVRLMVVWTFLFAAATASGVVKEDLTTAVREELSHPVHPGGVEGRLFWNGNAILFMYPPAFDFKPLGKAVRPYRFEVVGFGEDFQFQ